MAAPSPRRTPCTWEFQGRRLCAGPRPLLMGIVNVTPDSFSDGGRFLDPEAAVRQAKELVAQGADILDIGSESTRPRSEGISAEEELRRVLPVFEALAGQVSVPLSIDTSKAQVARRCLERGASIVNDVTGLRGDPCMAQVAAGFDAGVVVMHMQGTPRTMQANPTYQNVVEEVYEFLARRAEELISQGIERSRIVVDPGIGFGKTLEHNLQLLSRIERFHDLGRPVCVGHSRKTIIGKLTGRPADQRLFGTIGVALALCHKGVDSLRVHDVGAVREAIDLYLSVMTGEAAR